MNKQYPKPAFTNFEPIPLFWYWRNTAIGAKPIIFRHQKVFPHEFSFATYCL